MAGEGVPQVVNAGAGVARSGVKAAMAQCLSERRVYDLVNEAPPAEVDKNGILEGRGEQAGSVLYVPIECLAG